MSVLAIRINKNGKDGAHSILAWRRIRPRGIEGKVVESWLASNRAPESETGEARECSHWESVLNSNARRFPRRERRGSWVLKIGQWGSGGSGGKESGKHNGLRLPEKLGAVGSTAFFVGTRESAQTSLISRPPCSVGPILIRCTCDVSGWILFIRFFI